MSAVKGETSRRVVLKPLRNNVSSCGGRGGHPMVTGALNVRRPSADRAALSDTCALTASSCPLRQSYSVKETLSLLFQL